MTSRIKLRLTMLAIIAMTTAGLALAGIRVELKDVPAPAVKAIKDRFPMAAIRFVDKEGKDRYEFAMKEGSRLFDAGVMADGKLLGTKEEIPTAKVPAVVKQEMLKKYPGAEIVESEKLVSGEGKSEKVSFELMIKTGKGKQVVVFDAAGKLLGNAD